MDIYRSERLKYVPIGDIKHEEFFYNMMQEPAVLNADPSLPVGFTMMQVDAAVKRLAERKLLAMYVCLQDLSAKPIGFVALSKPNAGSEQHGSSSLSISITTAYQRQGYGREAIAWALDWAFDLARLHRVEIACFSWNPGAKRLYGRVGFREEGLKREVAWFMGAWHDMHEMAMLEHEWRDKWREAAKAGTWAPEDGKSYSDEQLAEKMGSA
ncbi:acyl-CoA N-acyltransferase [Nemania sp. NC0429]|nr:acyl-CoA N-acyltransferase [Nemania sp. NC0429]